MKEQKELIEAALDAVEDIKDRREAHLGVFETEKRLVKAAEAYRQAQEQPERRKAPWTDSEGNELFEGDVIRHPSGEEGTIFYSDRNQWRVKYDDYSMPSRLCLQIDDKGQAVKVSP